MKNAIVLCSGGLDSVTTAHYVKKSLGYGKMIILFFDYGQRTIKQEKKAAQLCAKNLKAEFKELKLPELAKISTSLINSSKKSNKIERKDLKDTVKESANWYVPCRNTIFLIYALAIAESEQIKNKQKYEIFTGFKNEGKEPFPDATQEFVEEMNKLQEISMNDRFEIIAPLIKKDKEDIIKLGQELRINFKETYSCYVGLKDKHCGSCLACKLRQEGFYWAGVKDPTQYNKR